jgi:hypothetical protein
VPPTALSCPRPAARSVYATERGVLYRLAFWTESEWEAVPAGQRPRLAEHVPGLRCWVGAVPVEVLN